MPYLPIKTERLLLRNFVADDWKAVHLYASDPEVVRYMNWGPNAETDSQKFIDYAMELEQVDPRIDFELAVVLPEENKLIGGVGIHISDQKNQEGWIGYCFNKQFWGQGLATEAAKALIDFGFSKLGLHRIFATAHPSNNASTNIMRKLRMVKEGCFRGHMLYGDQWRDSDIYAVLSTDLKV